MMYTMLLNKTYNTYTYNIFFRHLTKNPFTLLRWRQEVKNADWLAGFRTHDNRVL